MEFIDYTISKRSITLRLTNIFFKNLDHSFNVISDDEEIDTIKSEDTELYKFLYELVKNKVPKEDNFLDFSCFLNCIKLFTADFICFDDEFHFLFIENIYDEDSDYNLDGISIEELTFFCNYYKLITNFDSLNILFDDEKHVITSNISKECFTYYSILNKAYNYIFNTFVNQLQVIKNQLNDIENKKMLIDFLIENNIFSTEDDASNAVEIIFK